MWFEPAEPPRSTQILLEPLRTRGNVGGRVIVGSGLESSRWFEPADLREPLRTRGNVDGRVIVTRCVRTSLRTTENQRKCGWYGRVRTREFGVVQNLTKFSLHPLRTRGIVDGRGQDSRVRGGSNLRECGW